MARKIQEACSEMTMSLRRNLTRSKYGCQTRGPRRFCSLAFQFLMQPLTSGASASSSSGLQQDGEKSVHNANISSSSSVMKM